jgi:hypothetical protein
MNRIGLLRKKLTSFSCLHLTDWNILTFVTFPDPENLINLRIYFKWKEILYKVFAELGMALCPF